MRFKVGENHYAGAVRISTIMTKIGQINAQIQELKTKGKAEGSPTTIPKLQSHLKHIYAGLNEIYDLALDVKDPEAFYSVEELVKRVQGSDVKKKLLDYNSLGKGSAKTVYGILNEINQTAQVAQGISNFKKGILFEYFCAYALAKTDDLAKKGVKTVLDEILIVSLALVIVKCSVIVPE